MNSLFVLATLVAVASAGILIPPTPCTTCGEWCTFQAGPDQFWTGMCQANLICNQEEIAPNCAAPPSPTCVVTGDCTPGQTCVSGLCVPGCNAFVPCPMGQICAEGSCRFPCSPFQPCPNTLVCNFVGGYCGDACFDLNIGNTCVSSGDYCENNVCHTGCLRDSDCFGDSKCALGKCQSAGLSCSKNSDCSETELCHEGSCQAFCTGDAECPVPGSQCHEGLCAPSCAIGGPLSCVLGEVCHEDEICLPGCSDDGDCQGDDICKEGVCEAACESDADCIFDHPYCVNGQCAASESCDANCSTWFNGCGICECNDGTISGCAVPECEDPLSSVCADNAIGTCLAWFTNFQCGSNSNPRPNPAQKCTNAFGFERKCTAHDCCTPEFSLITSNSLQNLQNIDALNQLSQIAAIEQSQQYQVLAQLQLWQAQQYSQYGVQQQLMFLGPHHGHQNHWGGHFGWGY